MSKSRPKSQSKSRKRSPAKGKHGGLAAEAVKEQKPLSHFVLEFFSLLCLRFKLAGRMLFSLGSREKKKEPSSSRERPDAASSSSALAAPSVAAKRASEEQTEGLAVPILSSGTVNDKDPCDDPNSTGNNNEASKLDPEVVEAEFSRNGVQVGGIFRVGRVGYHRKGEAEVNSFEYVHETMIEDDEVECERPGSGSGDLKKRYHDLKKKYDDLKKKYDDLKNEVEVSGKTVSLRQLFSDFRSTQSAKDMDDGIKKEVLNLKEAKREQIHRIIAKEPFTRIVLLMLFQRANLALKFNCRHCRSRDRTLALIFNCSHWRSRNRFPKFSDSSADYKWWKQNFDSKKLEERLRILQVAAKNWNPKLEIFRIIKIVSDVNSRLHRQPSENEFNEKDAVKMFEGIDLRPTIRYLYSGDENLELEDSSIEYDAGDCKI